MENASKALIIAASILVAIMLVAMGVTVFNKARSSADVSSLDTTEINMFNSKFERYSGTQLGSQVKSLISFCISNANTNKDDPIKLPTVKLVGLSDTAQNTTYIAKGNTDAMGDTKLKDYISTGASNGNLTSIRNAIVSTHSYYVYIHYGDTGLIDEITIYWTKP